MASAVVVPVREANSLIGDYRKSYDPIALRGVPAHITLLYPTVPHTAEELARLLEKLPRTPFRLAATGRFPGVLYLAPEPIELFVSISDALVALHPQAQPYEGHFPVFVPHLTVAHADEETLDRIEASLRPALPIEAVAAEAQLLTESEEGAWRSLRRFPFRGR